MKNFQRDIAPETTVPGAINLPHAAAAEVADDFKGTQFRTYRNDHDRACDPDDTTGSFWLLLLRRFGFAALLRRSLFAAGAVAHVRRGRLLLAGAVAHVRSRRLLLGAACWFLRCLLCCCFLRRGFLTA